MSQRRLVALAFGLACLALAAGAVANGATGPALVRITDLETSQKMIEPAGGGPDGKTEVITQNLYKPPARRPIGQSQLICTFVDRSNRTCVGTYELPKGSIVVTGAISTRLLYEIAIVGGTGLFDNARGTLTVTATRFRPRHEVLLFRLLG